MKFGFITIGYPFGDEAHMAPAVSDRSLCKRLGYGAWGVVVAGVKVTGQTVFFSGRVACNGAGGSKLIPGGLVLPN